MAKPLNEVRTQFYAPEQMIQAVQVFADANGLSVSSLLRMLISNNIPGAAAVPNDHREAAE